MCEAVITTSPRRPAPTIGMAGTDPRTDFQRARWAYLLARTRRRLTRRPPPRPSPTTDLRARTPRRLLRPGRAPSRLGRPRARTPRHRRLDTSVRTRSPGSTQHQPGETHAPP